MNLASRWREAINHIALLKKELAAQQRKTTEALAEKQRLQNTLSSSERTQQQHSTPEATKEMEGEPASAMVEKSPSLVAKENGRVLRDVEAKIDRMDQILAVHNQTNNSRSSSNQTPPDKKTSPLANTADEHSYRTPPKEIVSTEENEDDYEFHDEKKSQSMDQAVTPSPEKNSNKVHLDREQEEEESGVDDDNKETIKKEEFFAEFKQKNSKIDLEDLEDPPLNLVTPTESPPPTPPQRTSPLTPDYVDMDASPPPQQKSTSMAMIKNQIASPLFPMTASPKLVGHSKSYNEEFPPDITPEATKHPRSIERKPMPEFNDIQEEEVAIPASSNNLITSNNGQLKSAGASEPLSGIDAFEASFATQFPESFSPGEAKKNNSSNTDDNEEIYNPFFPSPAKDLGSSNDTSSASSDRFSMSSSRMGGSEPSSRSNETETRNNRGGLEDDPSSPLNNPRPMQEAEKTTMEAQTPPTRRYNPGNRESFTSPIERYQTPPHGQKSPETDGSVEPKRPEKSGTAAARARYERALQPRGFSGSSRRFPRKAEWESEPGTSPVNASAPAPPPPDRPRLNGALPYDSAKLATAQARVKGRTALYSAGRSPPEQQQQQPQRQVNGDNEHAFSVRRHEWEETRRTSPTDSVTSKPWDEEVGDIPMETASPSQRRDPRYNTGDSTSTGHAISGFTRQPLARNRPWDRSNQEDSSSPDSTNNMTVNTENFSRRLPEASDDYSSSSSRFTAAGRSRRNVKQPVSYTEPSLSSKLRRGDVFFAKADQEDRSNEGRRQPVQDVSSAPIH